MLIVKSESREKRETKMKVALQVNLALQRIYVYRQGLDNNMNRDYISSITVIRVS